MTNQDDILRREAAARRRARRVGLLMQKSRARRDDDPNKGGYMLVEPYRDVVAAGAGHCEFSLSLSDSEAELSLYLSDGRHHPSTPIIQPFQPWQPEP